MQFKIDLVAKTSDSGGIAQSFADQLAQFAGCTSTLSSESEVFRVEDSTGFHFEMHRSYIVTLPDPEPRPEVPTEE